jgi:hypothetical protein
LWVLSRPATAIVAVDSLVVLFDWWGWRKEHDSRNRAS